MDACTWLLTLALTWTCVVRLISKKLHGVKIMFDADRNLAGARWPIVRLGVGGKTEVVLLSPAFFCLTTHWVGSSVPCSVDRCALCDVLPRRGLFYVAAMSSSRVSIVELGALSATHLECHCKLLHGGMSIGLKIELSRRGQRSPVRSEVVGRQDGCSGVTALDLANHVMALYKFPCCNPDESIEVYGERCAGIAQQRNERFAADIVRRQRAGVGSR